MNQYEGMFLFDPTFGNSFENCEAEVQRLLERAEAELVFCRKWDERRLAYRIKGRKRGVYALVYFKAEPDKIVGLERDVQLSENALRVLVLRADGVTTEMMERSVASPGAEATVGGGADRKAEVKPETPDKVEKPEVVEVDVKTEAEPVVAETPLPDAPGDEEPVLDDKPTQTLD